MQWQRLQQKVLWTAPPLYELKMNYSKWVTVTEGLSCLFDSVIHLKVLNISKISYLSLKKKIEDQMR